MTEYRDKFKDPRWQKRRLEILRRDDWCCQACYDPTKTLHIHHKWYERDADPWDYPDECLITLCEDCHDEETSHIKDEVKFIGNIARRRFLSSEINMLAHTILEMPMLHAPHVLLTVVDYHLRNRVRLQKLIDVYFEDIRKKHSKEKAPCEDKESNVKEDEPGISNIPG